MLSQIILLFSWPVLIYVSYRGVIFLIGKLEKRISD